MNAIAITAIIPAAKPAKRATAKPAPIAAPADKLADAAALLEASMDKAESKQGFAALVMSHKKELLKLADRASTMREQLRELLAGIALFAVEHNVARNEAGKVLAEVLGLKSLADNKDIANAWQYVAKVAGLESRKKGASGKTAAGNADTANLDSDSEAGDGKVVAAQIAVKIAENASAADVVDAFSKWAAKHKAQAREALEMIATWREMVQVQADIAKAA